MENTYSVERFKNDLNNGAFSWPGLYPKYFLCSDGECLSFDAAKENEQIISDAIEYGDDSGWLVVACDINWEDPAMFCAHTYNRIESAYAEDEAERIAKSI